MLRIKVIYSKKKFELSIESNKTVLELKKQLQVLTQVPPDMQKLIRKGKVIKENDKTLESSGIKDNDKILMIGSTIYEVSAAIVVVPQNGAQTEVNGQSSSGELSFCKQYKHKKIIDRGVPEDAMPAYKNGEEPVPEDGIGGVLDKYAKKCRIRLKLESDELWLCFDEKTISKYAISTVDNMRDQPIDGHDHYAIVRLQMRDRKDIWLYWVPQQYVKALKKAIH